MRAFALSGALILCAAAASAQHDHVGEAPARPLELVAGMGSHHHLITTKNPEAQKYFDQGLAFLYGFNHDEAARRTAVRRGMEGRDRKAADRGPVSERITA
jgi:hypothetical protein